MFYSDDNDNDMLIYSLQDILCDGVKQGDAGTEVDKPTRVWRVEMPDGQGPFNDMDAKLGLDSMEAHEALYAMLANWGCCDLAVDEQMGVTEAAFKQAHGHAAYGCNSVDALKSWFCVNARTYLHNKYNAKVIVYEVPVHGYILHVSDTEVVFSKPDSRVVAKLDLITLDEMKEAA